MLDFIKDLLGINRYVVAWESPFWCRVIRSQRSFHKWGAQARAKSSARIFGMRHWIERA